jgi:hypothetical protein
LEQTQTKLAGSGLSWNHDNRNGPKMEPLLTLGTLEAEGSLSRQLVMLSKKGRETVFSGCCTRCMLYTADSVLGVSCSCCMLYAVYTVHGECCTQCML